MRRARIGPHLLAERSNREHGTQAGQHVRLPLLLEVSKHPRRHIGTHLQSRHRHDGWLQVGMNAQIEGDNDLRLVVRELDELRAGVDSWARAVGQELVHHLDVAFFRCQHERCRTIIGRGLIDVRAFHQQEDARCGLFEMLP